MVRVRFDDAEGRRVTALLSGSGDMDVAAELREWIRLGARAPLPDALKEAEFLPGEGGGCLCDELEEPPAG